MKTKNVFNFIYLRLDGAYLSKKHRFIFRTGILRVRHQAHFLHL